MHLFTVCSSHPHLTCATLCCAAAFLGLTQLRPQCDVAPVLVASCVAAVEWFSCAGTPALQCLVSSCLGVVLHIYIYIYVHVCVVHGVCASNHVGTLSLYCPWHCPPAPGPENQFWWRGRENGKHRHVTLLGACCLMTVSQMLPDMWELCLTVTAPDGISCTAVCLS